MPNIVLNVKLDFKVAETIAIFGISSDAVREVTDFAGGWVRFPYGDGKISDNIWIDWIPKSDASDALNNR